MMNKRNVVKMSGRPSKDEADEWEWYGMKKGKEGTGQPSSRRLTSDLKGPLSSCPSESTYHRLIVLQLSIKYHGFTLPFLPFFPSFTAQ